MSVKTAYIWGPVSNFSAFLISILLKNNWSVHIPSKSALQFSLSPLDLQSSAQQAIEKAAGGIDKLAPHRDNLRFLENDEADKSINYDVIIFAGLPSNFDEARVSRSPWAATELEKLSSRFKNEPPLIILSSLWGAVQNDGIVPEEIEFERRKALTHFEGVCQQYELKILKAVNKYSGRWHLLRLPLVLGSTEKGICCNFSGLYKLIDQFKQSVDIKELPQEVQITKNGKKKKQSKVTKAEANEIELNFNPDATFWFLPADQAASIVFKIVEDSNRPRICNIVSTQSTLNQEWLSSLAQALGAKGIKSVEVDSFNFSGTLRSMLSDNIQVKIRNLFEVLGRYQQAPIVMNRDYFVNLISFAQENNWGKLKHVLNPELSADQIRDYFEKFLPENIDTKMLKYLSAFTDGLAFQIDENPDLYFLLKADAETMKVSKFSQEDGDKATVNFKIANSTFARLCQGKLPFEVALVSRALRPIGKDPISSIKACDWFKKVLKHWIFIHDVNNRVLQEAQSEV